MTTLLEDATLNWYKATLRWREAKGALREFRQEQGSCLRENEIADTITGETRGACFQSGFPTDTWCAICQASEPVWFSYRLAAIDMGVVVRALRRLCKARLNDREAQ